MRAIKQWRYKSRFRTALAYDKGLRAAEYYEGWRQSWARMDGPPSGLHYKEELEATYIPTLRPRLSRRQSGDRFNARPPGHYRPYPVH